MNNAPERGEPIFQPECPLLAPTRSAAVRSKVRLEALS
jgi:hypothetical protein